MKATIIYDDAEYDTDIQTVYNSSDASKPPTIILRSESLSDAVAVGDDASLVLSGPKGDLVHEDGRRVRKREWLETGAVDCERNRASDHATKWSVSKVRSPSLRNRLIEIAPNDHDQDDDDNGSQPGTYSLGSSGPGISIKTSGSNISVSPGSSGSGHSIDTGSDDDTFSIDGFKVDTPTSVHRWVRPVVSGGTDEENQAVSEFLARSGLYMATRDADTDLEFWKYCLPDGVEFQENDDG